MASQETAIRRLSDYANGAESSRENGVALKQSETEEYALRLTKSLQILQNEVKQHQGALEKVISPTHPPFFLRLTCFIQSCEKEL